MVNNGEQQHHDHHKEHQAGNCGDRGNIRQRALPKKKFNLKKLNVHTLTGSLEWNLKPLRCKIPPLLCLSVKHSGSMNRPDRIIH